MVNELKTTKIELIRPENDYQQLVYGVVAYSTVLSTEGLYISNDAMQFMAHRFLIDFAKGNAHIDVEHDNKKIEAYLYESFVTGSNPPKDFPANAWIAGVYVEDRGIWQAVLDSKINAFSAQFLCFLNEVEVKYTVPKILTGVTEPDMKDGHTHTYMILIDEVTGRILSGFTSIDSFHNHEIKGFSAVNFAKNHTHKFFTTY